jgi:hypothetical protein
MAFTPTPAPQSTRLHRALAQPALANRAIALAVLVPAATVLIVAAILTPDPAGMGTHVSGLGMPPCGFKAATSLPCVSCGMTTSFAHAADGRVLTAFTVQPMGTLLALTAAAIVWIAGYAAIFGVSLAPLGRWLGRPKVITGLLTLAGAAWAWTLSCTILGW